MDEKTLTVGDRLKIFREELNISARQMAISLNVDQSHYNKSEKGERNLSEANYKDLSTLYDLNTHWLLTGEGKMFLSTAGNIISIAQNTGQAHADKNTDDLLNYLLKQKLESMEKENSAIRQRLEEVERILNEKEKGEK